MKLLLSACLLLCAFSTSHGRPLTADIWGRIVQKFQDTFNVGGPPFKEILDKVLQVSSQDGLLESVLKMSEPFMKDLDPKELCDKLMDLFQQGIDAASGAVGEQFRQGREMLEKFAGRSMSSEDIMKVLQEQSSGIREGIRKGMALVAQLGDAVASGSMGFKDLLQKGEELMADLSLEEWGRQMMGIMQKGSEVATQAFSQNFKLGMDALQGMLRENMPKEQVMQMLKDIQNAKN